MSSVNNKILSHNNIAPPAEGRCGFFVARKQRYCKMLPPRGFTYCAEHLVHEAGKVEEDKKERVPCPLDPKHTVYKDNLKQHMKKCNATKKTQLPYFVKDVNIGLKDFQASQAEKQSLNEVASNELLTLINRVREFNSKTTDNIVDSLSQHSLLDDELNTPEYGGGVKKHLLQQASLLNTLEDMGSFEDCTQVIEFGAGRGTLSHWVQKAMAHLKDVHFYLIDRQSNRRKLDCYHKGTEQGPSFHRLNIDIQHLQLGKVDEIANSCHRIAAIGKHLCGGATDLSLRCLLEANANSTTEEPACKRKLCSISQRIHSCLFALCCYHRCTWDTYVGRGALQEAGFDRVDFHRLTKMATWATCGFKRREQNKNTVKNNEEVPIEHTSEKLGLTTDEQKEIGVLCKRTIDYGRSVYVRALGYQCQLARYIESDVTLENIAFKVYKKTEQA